MRHHRRRKRSAKSERRATHVWSAVLTHRLATTHHSNAVAAVPTLYGASQHRTCVEASRPAEAAEVTGIDRSKVYELLASGDLPSIRAGGAFACQ